MQEPAPRGVAAAAALAQPRRRSIARTLAAAPGGLSVAELAERTDLHPNAVRQHLRVLAAAGVVRSQPDTPSGRGRPTIRHHLVDREVARVSAHQELVRMLVGVIGRLEATDELLEGYGRQHGAALVAEAGREGITAAISRLGFAPHETTSAAEAREGALELRLDHCPFRDAVAAPGGEAVCTLHRGLLAGMGQTAHPGARLTGFLPRDPARAGCMVRFQGVPPA